MDWYKISQILMYKQNEHATKKSRKPFNPMNPDTDKKSTQQCLKYIFKAHILVDSKETDR